MPDIADRALIAPTLQHRSFDLTSFEFRDGESDGFTFEGVASVVDKPYQVRDMFGTFDETIREGAFNKSLKDGTKKAASDVFMFVNHRHADVPMASRNAGTLKLSTDPNLRAWATLDPARSDVVIARSAVMRGEMTQMSIGFTVNKSRDEWNADFTERTIHEVNLKEVSIVPIGANPYTSASMRSFDEFMDTLKLMDDLTSDDVERAISYFESLRTVPQIDPTIAARDLADRERLERLIAARPAFTLV